MFLASTSDIVRVITGAAVTVDVHASWLDYAASTVTPGNTNTNISTATITTVVPAPAAATQRNVKTLNIYNSSASTSVQITVLVVNGSGTANLCTVNLIAGSTLQYTEDENFSVIPEVSSSDSIIVASSNLTAQAANISATTLYSVGSSGAGIYRVSLYMIESQAATTSSNLPDSRIIYTDRDSLVVLTVPLTSGNTGNTTSIFSQGILEINAKASTNIQFDVGQVSAYASVGGTPMQFAFRARLEFLG